MTPGRPEPELALTRDAMQRAVLVRSARSPLTLGGGGVALAALATGAWLGGPALVVLAGAGAAAGFGGFAWSFFGRRLEHVRCHVEEVNARRERARLEELGRIRATLWDLAQQGEGADEAARGLEQFQKVHSRQETFSQLLGKKLNVGELTYTRYVAAVDTAYGAIIANLSGVLDRLRAAREDDAARLRERLRRLEAEGPDDEREAVRALRERVDLRASLLDEVEALLVQNDAAIAALEQTTAKVARMTDLERPGAPELDRVIRDLEELAERASLFAAQKEER